METSRRFKHRPSLVAFGALVLLISSLVFADGAYSIALGLSPEAKNWSVNFASFGGVVFLLVSIPGLVVGVRLLRKRRVLKCGGCGFTSDAP
jgi:hypothetical protein